MNIVPVYERFESNGLELVVNTDTGKAYASKRATARMLGVDEKTVRNQIAGADNFTVINAEIQTPGGIQGADLISSETVFKLALKYNIELAEKMGAAGANLYMLNLAGYKTKVVDNKIEDATDFNLKQFKYTSSILDVVFGNMFEPAMVGQLKINAAIKIDNNLKPLLEESKQLLINATATVDKLCTVTEIAAQLNISAVALNKLLIEKELQIKIPTTSKTQSKYIPTEQGKSYSKFTQSVDSTGTTFSTLRWSSNVINLLH